ncbi:MAG TPA: copper resistance CopC family protein [Candidatus Binatia bacterium]|nr:copper resistance CopC family protein [Candidatus Binatia bacterium]
MRRSRDYSHLIASASAVAMLVMLAAAPAFPHAFPLRAEPRVGSTVPSAPAKVTIWFDSEIEGAFSKIEVYDAAERRVDKNDPRVDATRTRLEVDLSPLPPGKYQVRWTVLSVDTHVTEGRFTFSVGR